MVTTFVEKALFFPGEYFEVMGMKPKLLSYNELLMSECANLRTNGIV
jgi:hypothetical protein